MHGAGGNGGVQDRPGHLVEYVLFRALLYLLSGIGWEGAGRLGRRLGRFAFDVVRLRRRVTLQNLGAAFPEANVRERTALARACYESFGVTFLELLALPRLDPAGRLGRMRITDPEVFAAVRREGRGAVLLTGHLGNWELGGSSIAALGHPVSVLVRRQKNRRVDAYVRRAREAAGMRVLYVDDGLRPGLRALRRGEFLAFLFDQDAGQSGVFEPFFGRPASTPLGPFRFARLAGCPIVLGLSHREADGGYVLDLSPPLRLREDLPGEEAEREALRSANKLLETAIRRYPAQWFWMHRRWKTRPPAA